MFQFDTARVSIRLDGYDVHWYEFFSVRYHHCDYGVNWARFAHDECSDHVDQCIWSVSFSSQKMNNQLTGHLV